MLLSPGDVLERTNAVLFRPLADEPRRSLAPTCRIAACIAVALVGIAVAVRAHHPALPADRGMTRAAADRRAGRRSRRRRPCWRTPEPREAILVVDHVSRWYGNVVAVNDIIVRAGGRA